MEVLNNVWANMEPMTHHLLQQDYYNGSEAEVVEVVQSDSSNKVCVNDPPMVGSENQQEILA